MKWLDRQWSDCCTNRTAV